MQVNPVRISLVISCIAVSFLKCVDHTALRADYSLIAVPLCGADNLVCLLNHKYGLVSS